MINQEKLKPYLNNCLTKTDFKNLGKLYCGKVRDNYSLGDDQRVIISTDRQSAFEIQFDPIPLKGQVLNQLSNFWFTQTKNIIPNHFIKELDPNIVLVKEFKKVSIEIVVRGYITGVTGTSMWKAYEDGKRKFCGYKLPDNLRKNQKLPQSIITPSTKAESGHDKSISEKEVLELNLTTKDKWEKIKETTSKLFEFGSQLAEDNDLILVDTKYEFGEDDQGNIYLIDEIHTPDSSRFWEKKSYEENFSQGKEPEYYDKEYLRLWLRQQGFKYGKKENIKLTEEVRLGYSQRCIELYERLTKQKFELPDPEQSIFERVENNLKKEFPDISK